MMELQDYRDQVDEIDRALLALLEQRMALSQAIGDYKRERGLPIFQPEREQAILDRVELEAGTDGRRLRLLFQTLMDISRSRQTSAAKTTLPAAFGYTMTPDLLAGTTTLLCQGTEGSFSHQAALRLSPALPVRFVDTFEEVAAQALQHPSALGLLPFDNSTAGSVSDVMQLLWSSSVTVVGEIELPIVHHLLGFPGTALSGLARVYSHPQALEQSSSFLKRHRLLPVPYWNTALAAEKVAKEKDPVQAAIASELSAKRFGLSVLAEGIQNQSDNATRFFLISGQKLAATAAAKAAAMVALPHQPGSLYRLLAQFAAQRLNLTKIESLRIPVAPAGGLVQQLFYIEVESPPEHPLLADILLQIAAESSAFRLLGFLQSYTPPPQSGR